MLNKIKSFLDKYCWCFPAFIILIGTIYYINLFERLSVRDLNRQISEKNQLITLTEMLSNIDDVKKSILTLDTFDNTYTYLLKDEDDTLNENNNSEIYHSAGCPFILKTHPHENKEIKEKMLSKKRGSFVTKEENNDEIVWEFRHFVVNKEKLLVITGITNYPKESIDNELQLSISILLLITAFLNWALIGYYKYLRSGRCKVLKNIKEN